MEMLKISDKDVSKFDEVTLAIAVVEGKIKHATSVYESMIELKELIQSAGSEVKAELVLHQNIDQDFYLDKESLELVSKKAEELGVTTLVFIDELNGTQMKNIEEVSNKKVVDRTILLMDILAKRTNRREGKIEVEKAQLKYRLTRLDAFQDKYKYGSGIGVNSPSSKRLLTDKDAIEDKIKMLDLDLSVIVKNRFVQRSKKINDNLPLVALTGYTNSGKSTLLNKLISLNPDYSEESKVIVKDKMLSTMDVSLRKAVLPSGREFLVVDTIGFVSDLPGIIRIAFRSTFEEVSYADLILKIFDASSSDISTQENVLDYTIERIGAQNKNSIQVFNKADQLDEIPEDSDKKIYLSAKSGQNFDKLFEIIEKTLFEDELEYTLLVPYSDFTVFNELKNKEIIEMQDFTLNEKGIMLNLVLSLAGYEKYKKYVIG